MQQLAKTALPVTSIPLVAILLLGTPCTATAKVENDTPLVATFSTLQKARISSATIHTMNDDFNNARSRVVKSLPAGIAKTDQGYGARFRVRYRFADGYVDIYSGIYDGALEQIYLTPRSFADAKHLAQTLSDKQLPIDFTKPAQRTARSTTYQSNADGCQAAMTLMTDAHGHVIEIDSATAC